MKSSKYIAPSSLALAAISSIGGLWATKGWADCVKPTNDGACAAVVIDDAYASTYAGDFTDGVFFRNDATGVIVADGVYPIGASVPYAYGSGIYVGTSQNKGPVTITNLGDVTTALSAGINMPPVNLVSASTVIAPVYIYNGASPTDDTVDTSAEISSTVSQGIYSNRRFILHNHGVITGADGGVVSEVFRVDETYDWINDGGTVIVNHEGGIIRDTVGGIYYPDVAISNGWDEYFRMDSITNVGTLSAATYHVANMGILGLLNNGQGVGNAEGAVRYTGVLPTHYNAVIYGTGQYGQLNYVADDKWGAAGKMSFGIYGSDDADLMDDVAASTLSTGTYANVLTGVSADNLEDSNTLTADQLATAGVTNAKASGEYGGYLWALVASALKPEAAPNFMSPTPLVELTSWDLIVFLLGPDAVNTLTAIRGLAIDTAAVMQAQQAAIINGLDHDCAVFGRNNLCVSAGVQVGSTEAANQSLGHLVAAYRISDLSRVGFFLDQQVDMPAVGGAEFQPAMPTVGAYFDYGAHDLTGLQIRVAASAGRGEMALRRSDSLENTEAGFGVADASYYGVLGKVGYGATINPGWVATPYAALRHTAVDRKAYAETEGDAVQNPVRYDAVTMAQTTAVLGARLNGKLNDKVSFDLEAGIEHDFHTVFDDFAGTSDIAELETFSVTGGRDFNRTRAFGGAAITVRVDDLTTVNVGVMARQMAYDDGLDVVARAGVSIAF